MSNESIIFEIKKMIAWYENKLAVSDNIKDKDYYSHKIEALKEFKEKID